MYIYKFRITSDDVEDFLRDIEILSNQTFEQFHYFIVETLEFKQSELASFFICDQKWRRKHEITLMDMGDDDSFTNDDDESPIKHKIPRTIMQNSVLNQHIVMPNQIHGIIELKDVANVGIQHFEPLPNQQNEFQKNNSPFYWFN